jgi:chromosomal replication initiation ATPase DnaA
MRACRLVEALVAAALGTAIGELRCEGRGRAAAVEARQVAMYLAHVDLGIDLTRIAEHFGRDRTTVAHACARIEDRRDDPGFERVLACLESALQRWRRHMPAGGDGR